MLEARNLDKTFRNGRRETVIVQKASFTVGDGEAVGIVGPSGCGKSTLARILCGTIRRDGGTVTFDGQSLFTPQGHYVPAMRKQIQLVGQQPFLSLDANQKIGSAIMEPMLYHKLGTREQCRSRAEELLKTVWLDPAILDRYPHELSGGMCQRVVIARALGLRPRLLIADESTSMLDTSAQARVIRLLHGLKEQGLSILLISHDLELVHAFSDRILKMEDHTLVPMEQRSE